MTISFRGTNLYFWQRHRNTSLLGTVFSSVYWRGTVPFCIHFYWKIFTLLLCGCGETANTSGLSPDGRYLPCRFDSCHPYHIWRVGQWVKTASFQDAITSSSLVHVTKFSPYSITGQCNGLLLRTVWVRILLGRPNMRC